MSEEEKVKKAKRKKRNKRIKKFIWIVILLLLLVGAFWLFVLPQLNASATTTYNSYTAARGTISNSMSFSGSISVVNDETLTSTAEGTVRKIYVAEGDKVASGDKLMRLSSGETIKSNFAGEVNTISVEEGDDVSANASLIEIVDFDNLKVSMRVDEYSVSSVSVGQSCEVTVTALSQTFTSSITHINRISSSMGSTAYYTVTCEFEAAENVLPGMQVTVTIPQDEASDVIVLSRDALSFDNGNSAYVLVKDESGEMTQTQVTLGVSNDNFVEITDGLSEGDTVYVVSKTDSSSRGGLASLFSSLTGGTSAAPSTGSMPSDFGGGNFGNSSGGRGNGGNMGGGMPSMP